MATISSLLAPQINLTHLADLFLFFSKNSILSANFFGLNAKRNALGFRTNRVSQIDSFEERDLIKGDFNNYGIEVRLLNNYKIIKII